jgi:hypothetical protein
MPSSSTRPRTRSPAWHGRQTRTFLRRARGTTQCVSPAPTFVTCGALTSSAGTRVGSGRRRAIRGQSPLHARRPGAERVLERGMRSALIPVDGMLIPRVGRAQGLLGRGGQRRADARPRARSQRRCSGRGARRADQSRALGRCVRRSARYGQLGQDGQSEPTLPLPVHCSRDRQYWDLRQAAPVASVQLPERCYSLDVRQSLMVVGCAERHIVIFDLTKPTVAHQVRCSIVWCSSRAHVARADDRIATEVADTHRRVLHDRGRLRARQRRGPRRDALRRGQGHHVRALAPPRRSDS